MNKKHEIKMQNLNDGLGLNPHANPHTSSGREKCALL